MAHAQENITAHNGASVLPPGAPALIAGGLTGETVLEWLTRWGYKTELAKGAEGSPRIRVALNGANFDIAFFSAGDGGENGYESIQFIALFELEKPIELERVNEWNLEKRFGTAGRAEEDKVFVKMDVQLDGITPLALKDHLVLWQAVMVEFMRFFSS